MQINCIYHCFIISCREISAETLLFESHVCHVIMSLTYQAVGGPSAASHRETSDTRPSRSGNSHPPVKKRKRGMERKEEERAINRCISHNSHDEIL